MLIGAIDQSGFDIVDSAGCLSCQITLFNGVIYRSEIYH